MKLSLMWLREHLEMPGAHDFILDHTDEIVSRLIRSTAEIEQVEHLAIDLSSYFLGKCTSCSTTMITLRIPEIDRTVQLPPRADASPDTWFLLFQESPHNHRYATIENPSSEKNRATKDLSKDTLLPPFSVPEHEGSGGWKRHCEPSDVRISIDNKSINHRPDLWSHRGIAREVAALMGWKLKPFEKKQILPHPNPQHALQVVTHTCDYFARLDLHIPYQPSLPWMALRLIRMNAKPYAAIIDLTNYVMFDIGQPLHAFDATRVTGPLVVRQAHPPEKLTLLDGSTINLQAFDCVVADENHALSLAGIKGGESSKISPHTTHIVLEAAHFSPRAIRHSSSSHRIRTESSTRFEKGLDQQNVITAVQRFLAIAEEYKLIPPQPYHMALWQNIPPQQRHTTELEHSKLEQKMGIELSTNNVYSTLTSLGFEVASEGSDRAFTYTVTVPSWRKEEISIPEDIIEEIARLRGYNNIPATLPPRPSAPFDTQKVSTSRKIYHHLAYGLRMQEVKSYPFFDEEFLQSIQLSTPDTATLRNPVSSQWYRLVTSLIPNLMRHLTVNIPEEEELRLFEVNTIWHSDKGALQERRKVAWLWYAKKQDIIDFYRGKQLVSSLCDMLRLSCSWHPVPPATAPSWWHSPVTALLKHDTHEIGYAGFINPRLLNRAVEGYCYGVELDFDYLVHYTTPPKLYEQPSKYPSISTDISMLASYTTTATAIIDHVTHLHKAILKVSLIDFFEKPEWHDKRSITIRIICGDSSRTMTHDEVQQITEQVVQSLVATFGVEVR